MKRSMFIFLVFCIVFSFTACTLTQKATSSKDAIEASKSMANTQEKINYLVKQAKTFYNSKEFQDAIDIAQYILGYLDKDSAEAKNLLEKAKQALMSKAKETVNKAAEDVKNKLGNLGK